METGEKIKRKKHRRLSELKKSEFLTHKILFTHHCFELLRKKIITQKELFCLIALLAITDSGKKVFMARMEELEYYFKGSHQVVYPAMRKFRKLGIIPLGEKKRVVLNEIDVSIGAILKLAKKEVHDEEVSNNG